MDNKSKEVIETIYSHSSEGYITTDISNRIIYFNNQIENITGWKLNELIGRDSSELYNLLNELSQKEEIVSNDKTFQVGVLYCKNSRKITLPVRQIEIRSGNKSSKQKLIGNLTIFNVSGFNTSDSTKIKDDFVSTVSHELRTPLTSIKGFADTLLRTGSKLSAESQKKYLTIIKDQADRLTRLVEDLLAVSRLESQSLQLTIRTLDIRKAIDKVCESLSSKTANHRIVRQVEEEIPNVWADADRLEQILTNLIDNAIKYSPSGSAVTIKVSTLLNEFNEKHKLKIEIIDQGIGISEKDALKIFTKFGRLDNPLTRQTQGTGLGLFITKSLVLALKGEIYVKSKPGETTFTVVLPTQVENPAIPLSTSTEVPPQGEIK